MKSICFILILLFTIHGIGQDDKVFVEMKKVPLGTMYHNKEISIKFVKVLNDSRCPKEVNCVRAGEAKIVVAIYEYENFIREKELVIDASGLISDANNRAFSSTVFSIFVVGLYPYPSAISAVPLEDYVLELGTDYTLTD